MTSERATRANRRNALTSTGPRTTAGKTRSKQNARKHGLSARDWSVTAEFEIEHLTSLIADKHIDNAIIMEAARAGAKAQLHLQRVKACEIALIGNSTAMQLDKNQAQYCISFNSIHDLLKSLHVLDRYKRRALSARKSATRHWIEIINEYGAAGVIKGAVDDVGEIDMRLAGKNFGNLRPAS